MVIPFSKKELTLDPFIKKGFFLLRECQVKHHFNSPTSIVLLEFGFNRKDSILNSELVLKDSNDHSIEYKNLMKDFLLIF
jgi:tRNA1(Val) A37 N6-methylase TrmN6